MQSGWSPDGWYFRRQDALLGPVTTGELGQLVAGGQLRHTDTLWQGLKQAADRMLLPTTVRAVLNPSRVRQPQPSRPGGDAA